MATLQPYEEALAEARRALGFTDEQPQQPAPSSTKLGFGPASVQVLGQKPSRKPSPEEAKALFFEFSRHAVANSRRPTLLLQLQEHLERQEAHLRGRPGFKPEMPKLRVVSVSSAGLSDDRLQFVLKSPIALTYIYYASKSEITASISAKH